MLLIRRDCCRVTIISRIYLTLWVVISRVCYSLPWPQVTYGFVAWFPQVYYVYGFMLLVFLILVIVTVCVTIVGTYFLLNAENYHWQWTSFFSAASTAGYVYVYSIYYYFQKTEMSGFFQTSFYFGYTLMFCIGLGILCGEWSMPSGGVPTAVFPECLSD